MVCNPLGSLFLGYHPSSNTSEQCAGPEQCAEQGVAQHRTRLVCGVHSWTVRKHKPRVGRESTEPNTSYSEYRDVQGSHSEHRMCIFTLP